MDNRGCFVSASVTLREEFVESTVVSSFVFGKAELLPSPRIFFQDSPASKAAMKSLFL